MSFPNKEQRKVCWDSRDKYWDCLDSNMPKDKNTAAENDPAVCQSFRKIFETSCPSQWVTHFDRKRDFNKFKEKIEKEGFDPTK